MRETRQRKNVMFKTGTRTRRIAAFDRGFFTSHESFTIIGSGDVGGKAAGLAFIRDLVAAKFPAGQEARVTVTIPRLTVLGTRVFETFMDENNLHDLVASDATDDRIAHAFQRADFPAPFLGDLRALVQQVRTPLAIRSSSLLEDAMYRPFAGVYGTKMIPNNQADPDVRFRRLLEAIKFVYASTYFRSAKAYVRTAGLPPAQERMAVIIQEIIGERHGPRFYPHLSGVARSVNFYPTGHARPEDGVVSLALGLGKTIVDGGLCWSYSPAYPRSVPPFASPEDLLDNTQTEFWAVNMGDAPAYDPIRETEYLQRGHLVEAEEDGVLRHLVSTYDMEAGRLVTGMGKPGARALTFAPLLSVEVVPLNEVLRTLLIACEEEIGAKVEIEFAATLSPGSPVTARLGFLQVRPMVVSDAQVEVHEQDLHEGDVLIASRSVLGNGAATDIQDILFLKPDCFDTSRTREMAHEIEEVNTTLVASGRPYVLIGFGRWGTSDPWLGVPVRWDQIGGARVIVEATLDHVRPDPSQGSHFFHNVTSFKVLYFSVPHGGEFPIRWDRLGSLPPEHETGYLKHVRLPGPLDIRVDGRSGRGTIRFAESDPPR